MATHGARTHPRPDWALWLTIETVSIRNLAFLSLDQEPNESMFATPGTELHARIDVLLKHVEMGSTILCRPNGKHKKVTPETTHLTVDSFRRWAHTAVGWDVPPPLRWPLDGDEREGAGVIPASVQQEPEAAAAVSENSAEVATRCLTRPSGPRKRGTPWTKQQLAELAQHKAKHGTKATAEHFSISAARVRRLLPTKPKDQVPTANNPFPARKR